MTSRARKAKKDVVFVFDWDGVVSNTTLLRMARAKALAKLGHSLEAIDDAAHRASRARGGYSPNSHARHLAPHSKQAAAKLAKIIYRSIGVQRGAFLFSDTRRTIAALKRRGFAIDVLTAGDAEFQQFKIAKSGARRLFRDVHVVRPGPRVPHGKLAVLRKIARSHRHVIFFDDRADTVAMIARAFAPDAVLPVLVWRKKERPPQDMRAAHTVRTITWKDTSRLLEGIA